MQHDFNIYNSVQELHPGYSIKVAVTQIDNGVEVVRSWSELHLPMDEHEAQITRDITCKSMQYSFRAEKIVDNEPRLLNCWSRREFEEAINK